MPADRYDDAVDLSAENNSHTMVIRAVGRGARVLDLGCATGQLAGVLTARGCDVVGVDSDTASLEQARDRCREVVLADLNTLTHEQLAHLGPFDVVVAADVLEHIAAPERLLHEIAPLLAPGTGYLVTSIPNVAHGSVRLALLAGAFPYQDSGLLDDTHIRFFTAETMPAMLRGGGFEPVRIDQTVMPPLEGSVLADVDVSALPAEAVDAVLADDSAYTYQFIVVAVPAPAPDSGLLALLGRADRELARARTDAATASAEAASSAVRVAELTAAVSVLEDRTETAERTLADIYRSRLWRAGQVYRRLRP